ncbi:MAG: SMC-Scp complex subunit ScpB [Bacteroidetes bacterium]|nr:SMC-Scp complex subunit ScpB [Bacteroidota bacterium]
MLEETTTQNFELKIPTTLKALVEALIFAAHEPLSIAQIRSIYHSDSKKSDTDKIDGDTIRNIIDELNREYIRDDRPYRIVSIAGGYQFATRPEYAEWLGRLHKEQGRKKLSQSGIETLAIIAYKQPITKAEVEKIRGVNCDYVIKTLLERELITVVGRSETVGRPLLYGTTREFLKHFGLNDITDLPRPREIEEILGESQFETERRMLEAQAAADAAKKESEEFKSRLPHIPKKKAELNQKEAQIFARQRLREIRIIRSPRNSKENTSQQEPLVFQQATSLQTDSGTTQSVQQNGIEPVDTTISQSVSTIQPAKVEEVTNLETQQVESIEQVTNKRHGENDERVDIAFKQAEQHTTDIKEQVEIKESASAGNIQDGLPQEELMYVMETSNQSSSDNESSIGKALGSEIPKEAKSRWQRWKEKVQNLLKKLFD